MQKVLVAEIGSETTVVNAFGDLSSENPLIIGQGISPTTVLNGDVGIGLKFAIRDLEKDIGPVGSLGEIPFYVTSSLHSQSTVREVNKAYINGGILPTPEAIMKAAQLIYEEVGDVLVIDVGGASTNVYSVTSELLAQRTVGEDLGVTINASSLVKLLGENKIKEHHGQEWEKLLKFQPETPEEMALSAELAAAAISIALQRHSVKFRNYSGARDNVTSAEGRNLTRIRWIIGTGVALTQLPNGIDVLRETVKAMDGALFTQDGIAIMIDKDCIMASLGVLTNTYRNGTWQLMRESFGVEN